MIKFSGCSESEAFLMASYNPAKRLGLETKGMIKENNDFESFIYN